MNKQKRKENLWNRLTLSIPFAIGAAFVMFFPEHAIGFIAAGFIGPCVGYLLDGVDM